MPEATPVEPGSNTLVIALDHDNSTAAATTTIKETAPAVATPPAPSNQDLQAPHAPSPATQSTIKIAINSFTQTVVAPVCPSRYSMVPLLAVSAIPLPFFSLIARVLHSPVVDPPPSPIEPEPPPTPKSSILSYSLVRIVREASSVSWGCTTPLPFGRV